MGDETEEISNIYFNELSDIQRAQIETPPLFSSLLVTKASYFVAGYDRTVKDSDLEALQERIDRRKNVTDVAGIAEIEENEEFGNVFLSYDYGSEGGDMLIPSGRTG